MRAAGNERLLPSADKHAAAAEHLRHTDLQVQPPEPVPDRITMTHPDLSLRLLEN